MQRGLWYNFKDSVMRRLSWWPPSSRSWDSNEGRTVRSRKEGGELSLSQNGRTRLPAFSLHLPNCQGPQASPSQGSRVATSTTTTTQPHRLAPVSACKSTLSSGKPICFCCSEARGSGLYSSLPVSLLVSLLSQADKQTQTQKPKQIFFLIKKKKSNKRNKKTGCASLGYCKGNTAQSLHSRKAPGRSRVQGQNLPQSPGHILLGCLRTNTSFNPRVSGCAGRLKFKPPNQTHTLLVGNASNRQFLPPNSQAKKVSWMLFCTFHHKEG